MRGSVAVVLPLLASLCVFGGEKASAPIEGLLDYTYAVDRRDVEKCSGGLKDGKLSEGIGWHTKFVSKTSIVCELKETCELERIEIYVPKWTKWYIVKELQVSLDDGLGDFGDPYVLPGLPNTSAGKATRDASCTNHLFVVSHPGRAVRVKVTVVSDAAASIGEIRLFGRTCAARSSKSRPLAKEPVGKGRLTRLENRRWKVAVHPVGGRVASLYSKTFGFELTDTVSFGAFSEEAWDRPRSHGFLASRPYALSAGSGPGLSLKAIGNAQGGGVDFLRVEKRFSASDDATAFHVDYRFVNIPEAMAKQSYGLFIRAALGVAGKPVTCYYPTADGVVALRPGERGSEYWSHRPVRGWMASVTKDGTGVALTFPPQDIQAFYSWFGEMPTLDARLAPVLLDCDEGYDVRLDVLPFRGLSKVSGAGGGLVGELSEGICRVVSSRACTVIARAEMDDRTLVFSKPGELQSFETSVSTVKLLSGGREICRLETTPREGAWKLEPLVPSRAPKVASVDLNAYTNFSPTGAAAWAKPLPGRRLKVSFVTGMGNQLEIGRLAERFDMEYRTAPISVAPGTTRSLGNPVFSFGDYFSQVGVRDSVTAIKRTLDWDCQVLVFSGVPFEVLPEDVRKLVLDKVRAGAGLVWIGGDRDVPELGLKLTGKPVERRTAQAVGETFADVPFALLGEEPVAAFSPEGATVHAACADRPYLTERTLGRGRVFNLPYRSLVDLGAWIVPGLTPDLLDFYPDRAAPAEEYYSLLAKVILAAGGKRLPVRLGAAKMLASAACRTAPWDRRARAPP